MADILATVSGQSLVFTSMPVIASHGVNEDYVEFTFDAEWTGFAKVATFYHERTPETIYTTVVNGSNRALVPHEVTANAGRIFIGVTGTQGSIKLTSEVQPYPILPGSNEDGVNSEPITPELYDQILSAMAEMVGTPLTANTAADMTDTTRIYVYTGSEVGYVNGSWYYYNGSSWQVGGTYNSQAISDAFYDDIAQLVKQSAVASESDSVPYLYRPTPNPSAILADEEIVGGTVAWNQLQGQTTSRTNAGITYTYNSTDGTLHVAGTASAASYWESGSTGFKQDYFANHVYLLLAGNDSYAGSGSTYRLYFAQTAFSPRYVDTPATMAKPNASGNNYLLQVAVYSGTTVDITLRPQLFDLTAMFGSTIADYLYTLESGTAGAGVAKLREWGFLSKVYFPYNAGELISVNTEGKEVTGFNLFDKSTVANGYISDTYGTFTQNANARATDYIEVIPGVSYFIDSDQTGGAWGAWYDADKNYISGIAYYTAGASDAQKTKTAPTNAHFMRLTVVYNSNGNIDTFCVSVANPATNHVRVPYRQPITYPTTATDLNGIFKLDANNQLYADGDVYGADGTIDRKWNIVDLGDLNWTYGTNQLFKITISDMATPAALADRNKDFMFSDTYMPDAGITLSFASMADKTALKNNGTQDIYFKNSAYTDAVAFKASVSGIYMLYPLATEETETADPYPATQIAPKGGTERRIDNRDVPVPVGHRTTYSIGVPDVPSNANNATLHATVSGGRTTLTWS